MFIQEKTCPPSHNIFSTSISHTSTSKLPSDTFLACTTSEARMVNICLHPSVNIAKRCKMGASHCRVPVAARIEHTHEMIHAVDGWKCTLWLLWSNCWVVQLVWWRMVKNQKFSKLIQSLKSCDFVEFFFTLWNSNHFIVWLSSTTPFTRLSTYSLRSLVTHYSYHTSDYNVMTPSRTWKKAWDMLATCLGPQKSFHVCFFSWYVSFHGTKLLFFQTMSPTCLEL